MLSFFSFFATSFVLSSSKYFCLFEGNLPTQLLFLLKARVSFTSLSNSWSLSRSESERQPLDKFFTCLLCYAFLHLLFILQLIFEFSISLPFFSCCGTLFLQKFVSLAFTWLIDRVTRFTVLGGLMTYTTLAIGLSLIALASLVVITHCSTCHSWTHKRS